MSSMNLNLLPSQAKFQATRMKLTMISRWIMIGTLAVWIALLVGVYGVSFVLQSGLNREESKLKRTTEEYLSLSDNIVSSQKLKYKAKLVGGVLNQRFQYGKAFESIGDLFPDSIKLENFELKNQGLFNIVGTTSGGKNVILLEDLVKSINQGRDKSFKSANLRSIGVKNGNWNFSMEVSLR